MIIARYLRAHCYVPERIEAPHDERPLPPAPRRTCPCGRYWDEAIPVRTVGGENPDLCWRVQRHGAITAQELERWSKGIPGECTGECKLPIVKAPSLRQP
jgi:hypothetical protein